MPDAAKLLILRIVVFSYGFDNQVHSMNGRRPMHRITGCGSVLLAATCLFATAQESPPAVKSPDKKAAAELYDGFKDDQKKLRSHTIHKGRNGAKDTRASSAEACLAAQRIFSKVPLLFKTRDEVFDIFGDPATISDYNRPAGKEPGSPLVYVFDSGFGGLRYTLSFSHHDKMRVTRIEVDGQN